MEIILKYFPEISPLQREKFFALKELYYYWNEKINVVSRKDIEFIFERHVLHSLGIAKVIQFKKNTKVLDIGTGGGFPGIPLAILFPESNFTLVDSIGKKIRVVEEVSNALDLKNVKALNLRAENLNETFHFIVSRAVTDFPTFLTWIKNKISNQNFNDLSNGILYLKGGDLKEEFGRYYSLCRFHEMNSFFEEDFFATKKVVYYPWSKR